MDPEQPDEQWQHVDGGKATTFLAFRPACGRSCRRRWRRDSWPPSTPAAWPFTRPCASPPHRPRASWSAAAAPAADPPTPPRHRHFRPQILERLGCAASMSFYDAATSPHLIPSIVTSRDRAPGCGCAPASVARAALTPSPSRSRRINSSPGNDPSSNQSRSLVPWLASGPAPKRPDPGRTPPLASVVPASAPAPATTD